MIDLHYVATYNGQKVLIALEELELAYRPIMYDMFEGDHHTAAFGRINPNHKLPAIVDNEPAGVCSEPFAVFESGAILQYLADKTGKLMPRDSLKRSVAIQWLTWQVAGLGPMRGQAMHFVRYAPEQIPYAITRYVKELKRLLTVLERRLGQSEYVAGTEYTIADIAIFPAVGNNPALVALGIDFDDWPNTKRWHALLATRPAIARARSHSNLAMPEKYSRARQVLSPSEWSNMFGDVMHNSVKL
jgi:GST-like protein